MLITAKRFRSREVRKFLPLLTLRARRQKSVNEKKPVNEFAGLATRNMAKGAGVGLIRKALMPETEQPRVSD
jgi:hypothetical protein